MYKVYADDVLVHDSRSPEKNVHLISPNLSIADCAAGSFDFTAPKDNPGYDAIERMVTTLKVKKENETIWSGRVLSENEDFWKRRKFTCEGALAYLNDSIQELKYYDNYTLSRFFTKLIEIHNSKVPTSRQFIVGTISMNDVTENYEYKTEYKSTYETINDVFINRLGGHLRVRYDSQDRPIIDYLKDYPNTSEQDINFGSNLLDFTKNWDLSNLVTVILPRGKQLDEDNDRGDRDYLTIESVNGGSKYIENIEAVRTYGRIEKIVDFNDAETASQLKILGDRYISSQQFDDMILSVSAVDLHMLNPNIVSFELLDQVKCYSSPHGLDKVFPITQIDIPLDTPENIKYTMGSTVTSSMSGRTTASTNSIKSNIAVTKENLLQDAKHQATNLINQKTTGYVNIITEQETSQALIISDKPDLEQATKLWRWNLNGLGYLDMEDPNNPNHDYKLAITSAGEIVADFVKTGMLSDGYGLNWWNLTTGEFQLAYNTDFASKNGNTITIVDVVTLARQGVDDAEEAQETADTAMRKQSGNTNILRGTNKNIKVVTNGSSNWSDGTWDGIQGDHADKTVVDISGAPNPSISKGFRIRILADNSKTYIRQCNVDVASKNVYTLSCYARGTAEKINLAYHFTRTFTKDADVESPLTNNWKRYYTAFTIPEGDNKIEVRFGTSGSASKECYICGMKLERGNTASDWSESEQDTQNISIKTSSQYTDSTAGELKTYTSEYVEVISQHDREFTKSQRKALDESFTQYKVLQRLTNNGQARGIYLKNNQLLMNADYIRSGTIDAGIVKAGILIDAKGNNRWDMAKGYLYATKIEAINMQATGRFQCGSSSGSRVVMEDGALKGYIGSGSNSWVGEVAPVGGFRWIPTNSTIRGVGIRGKDTVDIRSPRLCVRNANDHGTSLAGVTKRFEYWVVDDYDGYNIHSCTHGLYIINGIVVDAW